MAKNKLRAIGIFFSNTVFLVGALITCTVCWFNPFSKADTTNGLGYVASSFFARGDGSSSEPYILNEPVHLYNLAWLQYFGFFNQLNDSNVYTQYYFEMETNLDMTGYTLPPIGTTDNPFIGNFIGDNYTISNLKVSNTLGTDNITSKPSLLVDSEFSGVNIVGLFGVVGNINDVLPTGSYLSSVVSVKDFKMDNVLVKSDLQSTLIGLVAGYVNGVVDNVGVIDSSLNVKAASSAYLSSLTTNLSDYSLYGYCTADYVATTNVDEVSMAVPSTTTSYFTVDESGTQTAPGGSIALSDMYQRLNVFYTASESNVYSAGIRNQTYNVDINNNETLISSTNYTTETFSEYYDGTDNPLHGKVTFSRRSDGSTQYLYLYGKENIQKTVVKNHVVETSGTITNNCYYLYNTNGYYLTLSGSSLSYTTSSSSATPWVFVSDSGGNIYTINSSGTTYYLTYSNTTVSVTTTNPNLSWSYSGSTLRAPRSNNRYYYFYYYSGYFSSYWSLTSSSSTMNRTATTLDYTTTEITRTDTDTVPNGVTTNGTYLPINVKKDGNASGYDYTAANNNTGYIVSGSNYHNTNYPYQSGDIRVSEYAMSKIGTALNTTSSTYTDSRLEVITQTYLSDGPKRISDSHNANNTSYSSSVSGYSKISVDSLGLQKYEKSRNNLQTTLTGQSNIYGLHFMQAAIDKSNYITAEKVLINNETISNYQLPQDSIDFHLQEKGYVNFFAGTYFVSTGTTSYDNNTFFSFHQIFRDTKSPYDITDIKEISKIYKNTDSQKADYIYLYSDGTYSGTLPTNFIEVFDTDWIKNPKNLNKEEKLVDYAMYYYEIPANVGEYALGSVSGKDGAYLIYLDISANGQTINRTATVDNIKTTTYSFKYPLGSAFIQSASSTISALDTGTLSLSSSFYGAINFLRNGDTLTLTTDNTNYGSYYVSEDITMQKSGTSTAIKATADSTSTSEIKRLTYLDYNVGLETLTQTTFTESYANGTLVTRTYTSIDAATGEAITGAADGGDVITVVSTTYTITFRYAYDPSGSVSLTFSFAYSANELDQDNRQYYTVTSYTIDVASDETLTIYVIYDGQVIPITITNNGTQVYVTA